MMTVLETASMAATEQMDGLAGGGTLLGNGGARIELNECGESVFYPLSPVQLSLYYSLLPEIDVE